MEAWVGSAAKYLTCLKRKKLSCDHFLYFTISLTFTVTGTRITFNTFGLHCQALSLWRVVRDLITDIFFNGRKNQVLEERIFLVRMWWTLTMIEMQAMIRRRWEVWQVILTTASPLLRPHLGVPLVCGQHDVTSYRQRNLTRDWKQQMWKDICKAVNACRHLKFIFLYCNLYIPCILEISSLSTLFPWSLLSRGQNVKRIIFPTLLYKSHRCCSWVMCSGWKR